jgi:hemoglobin
MTRSILFVRPFVLAACIAAAGCASAPATPDTPKSNSLYVRLGGYDAIAALVDNFIVRMGKDTITAPFFAGLTPRQGNLIRQGIVDQLCQASGGPCIYTGPSMKQAHKDLGITPAVWQAEVSELNAAMDYYHIGRDEKNEVLAIVRSLEADIVTKP